jgi:dTDP-4-dehydrorhamnose reductase
MGTARNSGGRMDENSLMKIAVIGGTGFLGRAIARVHRGEHELLIPGSRDVDIRDRSSVETFVQQHRPDWVILAAAMADVDRCEREPELAEAMNHEGAINVAEECKTRAARLMFISTDYVFGAAAPGNTPWEIEDAVCPVNAYGRSKVAGEVAVRAIVPHACIARVSWLFGAEGRCFPNKLLESIESGERKAFAISDQHSVPNFAREIARCLLSLIESGGAGTVHVTNQGVTSWYDFSGELLTMAGFRDIALEPITMAQTDRIAKRPHYSALSDKSLRSYGIAMPHWRESLPEYLADRAALAAQDRSA